MNSNPYSYPVRGFDVSHHQAHVDFNLAKQNCLKFSFIKASPVVGKPDPAFKTNWANAKSAGIIRGAYCYIYAKGGRFHSVIQQAELFCQTVGQLEKGDLPPVLDLEESGISIAEIQGWLTYVEQHLGMKPLIYCNLNYYNNVYSVKENFPNYQVWIARYPLKGQINYKVPEQNWLFWQFSEEGEPQQVGSPPYNNHNNKLGLDMDVFNGTIEQLQAICKQ